MQLFFVCFYTSDINYHDFVHICGFIFPLLILFNKVYKNEWNEHENFRYFLWFDCLDFCVYTIMIACLYIIINFFSFFIDEAVHGRISKPCFPLRGPLSGIF